MVQKKKLKTFQYKQVFEPGNYLQNAAFQTPEIQQHIGTKSCARDHTGFQFSEVVFSLLSWALEEKELHFLIFCERKVWNCFKKIIITFGTKTTKSLQLCLSRHLTCSCRQTIRNIPFIPPLAHGYPGMLPLPKRLSPDSPHLYTPPTATWTSPEHLTSSLMDGFLRDQSTFHQKLITMFYNTYQFWQMNLPGERLFHPNIPANAALETRSIASDNEIFVWFVCMVDAVHKGGGSVLPPVQGTLKVINCLGFMVCVIYSIVFLQFCYQPALGRCCLHAQACFVFSGCLCII